ncbi:heterokaryon incompatibility protein-domain-containing protein [Paraphoma chrysanthemicola]|uniref:Heterokaryon incompatibility protein-domain-containing protein n=1 Tax=Paraphoma chrysanthemicola TaxID=798071 RepID=A0A8K0W2S2_9PLEO|nr:heterokaryon incompatibility protein-domain-containing protein [Paraphoma chrysanthemicola]
MGISRKGQPRVGDLIDSNIRLISFTSQSAYGPSYSAQNLSTKALYDLKVFSDKWVTPTKKHVLKLEIESLKTDKRILKVWENGHRTFVLMQPGATEKASNIDISESCMVPLDKNDGIRPGTDKSPQETAGSLRGGGKADESGLQVISTTPRSRPLGANERPVETGSCEANMQKRGVQEDFCGFPPSRTPRANKNSSQEESEVDMADLVSFYSAVESLSPASPDSHYEDCEPPTALFDFESGTLGEINQQLRKLKNVERRRHQKSQGKRTPREKKSRPAIALPSPEITTKATYNTAAGTQVKREPNVSGGGSVIIEEAAAQLIQEDQMTREEQALRNDINAKLYSEHPIRCPSSQCPRVTGFEIRLLKIEGKDVGDAILCTMDCYNLQAKLKPDFIALSYFWGGTDKTHEISVDGQPFYITANLHQALSALRKPEKCILVWVDAVCINQQVLQERDYQVSQMTKIYSDAKEVIAWLGGGSEASNRAMELVNLGIDDLSKQEPSRLRSDLDDIFSRDYWCRVWVVQEIAAALRNNRSCMVQCGDKTVTLNQFKRLLRNVLRHPKLRDVKSVLRPKSLLALSTTDPNRKFLSVLWESSSLQATEDLDRIYAIRGISPKFYRNEIKVDYKLTYAELVQKVTTRLVNYDQNLDVLCYFHAYTSKSTPATPSWLRDFRLRNPGIPPEIYSADKGQKANAEVKNNLLRTRGICIGRVKELQTYTKLTASQIAEKQNRLGPHTTPESDLQAIETFATKTLKLCYPNETAQSRDNRFLEMVAGGKRQVMEQLGQDFERSWRWHFWKRRIEFEQGISEIGEWKRIDEAFSKIFARVIGRSVFTTAEGSLGLGPRDMKENDLVCVLYGSRLPVVLRKDERYFTFVGPAYVDGAMNGEFVRDSEKPHQFWIR